MNQITVGRYENRTGFNIEHFSQVGKEPLCLCTTFRYHDFEFNECSQRFHCVNMNSCIFEEVQLTILSYNRSYTDACSKNALDGSGILNGNAFEVGISIAKSVGPSVPNEFGTGILDFPELEPSGLKTEICVRLAEKAGVSRVELLKGIEDRPVCLTAGFQFKICRHEKTVRGDSSNG